VSAISAVTSSRQLYFRFKEDAAFSGEDVMRFVLLLLRHIRGRLVIIWDNAQQHHAKLVTELTKKHPRLRIEFLPGYSPDFNPDEGVWNHTKRVELGNFAPHDKEELVAGARGALRRLKRRPGKIGEFWRESVLPLGGMEELLNIPGHR
jgi:putative transposase